MRNERSGDMRKGGGLAVLIKDGLTAIGYIPPTPKRFQKFATERVWTLISGRNKKIAVGFVYLASTSVPNHVEENKMIYEMLQGDIRALKEEGYSAFLMGDFNGHLGPRGINNPQGVLGDDMVRN